MEKKFLTTSRIGFEDFYRKIMRYMQYPQDALADLALWVQEKRNRFRDVFKD